MDVKEAVATAKAHLAEAFSDETLRNLGLEEIRYEDDDSWSVTLGFSRQWIEPKIITTALGRDHDLNRTYKTVRIDDASGKVVSITDRFLEAVG